MIIDRINLVLGMVSFIISFIFIYKLYLGARGVLPRGGVLIVDEETGRRI